MTRYTLRESMSGWKWERRFRSGYRVSIAT